jgi:hypothetical protein
MISGKLVHLIETHATEILQRVVSQIRREEDMVHIRALLDSELREWNIELLERLGHWLSPANREDLAHRYERLGKVRFEQDVPLHESVRGLCLMREKTLDFVEEHIASNSSVELYAEEEMDRRLSFFFDLLMVNMVRGYERALRRAASLSAA